MAAAGEDKGARVMKATVPLLVILAWTPVVDAGDEPKAPAAEAPVSIVLGPAHATATPWHQGSSRTGGGNVHVAQLSPDTLSVTVTGAAAAKPHPFTDSAAGLAHDVTQTFEVVFHSPEVKRARLVLWARCVGVLRSPDHGGKKGGSA